MMKLITSIVGFSLVIGVIAIEPLPDAENVCNRTETVKREGFVERPVKYEFTVNSMCGFIPCKKTIKETRINKTREIQYEDVVRRECCEGYAITPEYTCAAICLRPCQSGKCVAPNRCECHPAPTDVRPGFAGPQCNRFVCASEDRWGSNCDKPCQCTDTAFCEASTGKCSCRPGWRGTNCTEECDLRSGCDDIPFLPPVFEPEVNVFKIDDNVAGRMSALSLESQDREIDRDDKKAFSKMLITHLHINLFLVILVSALVFAIFCYNKKLNQMKNELYYAAYQASDNRGSDASSRYESVYGGNNNTITNRPRMPLPVASNYLDKNLSFDAATRNAISGKDECSSDRHVAITINSKTEKHLAMSKEQSQQNIYSDIESSCVESQSSKNQLSSQRDENEYQVPRTQVRPLNETNSHSNLYEELVPNSPAKAEDKK